MPIAHTSRAQRPIFIYDGLGFLLWELSTREWLPAALQRTSADVAAPASVP
jgi:hypothetical protein